MKLWITGASGMLGSDLQQIAREKNHEIWTTDLDVDITDGEAVHSFLSQHPVDIVINCAAYTAVDQAETDMERAQALNALGPEILAQQTQLLHVGLIHVSTDYVLGGESHGSADLENSLPLSEEMKIAPMNVYGQTKAEGEQRVIRSNPDHWIVRTAWLYGMHGKNFVKTMLRLMAEKDELKVVNDQWGTPTWSCDLAQALIRIAESGQHPGIYHYSNAGQITWFEFAQAIQEEAKQLGLLKQDCKINPVDSSAFPSPARRPHWSVLDKSKIQKHFDVDVPPWRKSLNAYLQREAELSD